MVLSSVRFGSCTTSAIPKTSQLAGSAYVAMTRLSEVSRPRRAPARYVQVRQPVFTSGSVEEMRRVAESPFVQEDMETIAALQQEVRASQTLQASFSWVLGITAKDLGLPIQSVMRDGFVGGGRVAPMWTVSGR